MGTGVRIATGAVRPRNDRFFTGSTGKCPAGGQGRPPLRRCVTKKCVGEGLCPSRGRGRTPPLRKRNKRCNGRATARVAPTKALQGVRRGERNSPVTASPCQPPLGKGAMGTGDTDCEASANTGLAMTLVFHGGAVCGGAHGPRPTDAFSDKKGERRGRSPYCLNRIDQKFLIISTISAPMRF